MNPYDILGVSANANVEEIKEAYKNKSKQYYGMNDEYSKAKLKELDDAYDAVINSRSGTSGGYASIMSEIRTNIKNGDINTANSLLNSIPREGRDAQWYFLSGSINKKRGYIENAFKDFTTAHTMEPENAEYSSAYESMRTSRQAGYRTVDSGDSLGCSTCSLCETLICADCLCHCCNCR